MDTTAGAPHNTRLRRDVGSVGLLFAAVGSIIGSGWLFGAFKTSGVAGPAGLFSWLIAAGMIMLIGLTYAELGPMFPISGGVVRYPHMVWGSFTSYSLGFITWISTAAVPAVEVAGALTYATKYAGFTHVHKLADGSTVHTLTALGLPVAILLMAAFVVLNYYGIKLFAQVNNVLVWWKLFIIVLVVVVFLIAGFSSAKMGGPANFSSHGFMPHPSGVFTAIATAGITFSFLGFRQGIELAGETKNPKRNVPLAVVGSILICGIIYALLQIAFTMGVPASALSATGWENLSFANDFGPLAAISELAGITWLAYLLYADAIISPSDTGLVYTTVSARVSYAMGKNANSPAFLAKTNTRGVPAWSLLVTFVVGLILFLPFPSWQQLVGFITSATVISFGSGPLVVAALRRQMPERIRPFRLPGGDIIPFLAFYSANMIVFWGGWDTNKKLFLTIVLGYILLVIFQLTGDKRLKPPLDFKAGLPWVVPWFVAMTLVSWLADPTTHPGAFYWMFLVNAVISAGIYYIAVRCRLPKDKVEHHIVEAEGESVEEDQLAGGHIG